MAHWDNILIGFGTTRLEKQTNWDLICQSTHWCQQVHSLRSIPDSAGFLWSSLQSCSDSSDLIKMTRLFRRGTRWLVSGEILLVEYQTDFVWFRKTDQRIIGFCFDILPYRISFVFTKDVFIDIFPSQNQSQDDSWCIGRSLGSSWENSFIFLPALSFIRTWVMTDEMAQV